ncbi:unnamed protein product, partial [Polarella glacialis]
AKRCVQKLLLGPLLDPFEDKRLVALLIPGLISVERLQATLLSSSLALLLGAAAKQPSAEDLVSCSEASMWLSRTGRLAAAVALATAAALELRGATRRNWPAGAGLFSLLAHVLLSASCPPRHFSVQQLWPPRCFVLTWCACAVGHLAPGILWGRGSLRGVRQVQSALAISSAAIVLYTSVKRFVALPSQRRWRRLHAAPRGSEGDAPYCSGGRDDCSTSGVAGDCVESSAVSGEGCFSPRDDAAREELYGLIVDTYHRGLPMVLLARQAPLYPLFFDVDIYGGCVGAQDAHAVHDLVWDVHRMAFLRCIGAALMQIFPHTLENGIQVAAFCSSGFCSRKGRFKASYHLVFPEIMVDRPVMCLEPPIAGRRCPSRHILARDHVVCYLSEEVASGGELAELQSALESACDHAATASSSEESWETPAGLNDWSEVLDENPLWYDPRPDARTGLRLPFTDKVAADSSPHAVEGRPKLPLGRWQLHSLSPWSEASWLDLQLEPLAGLDAETWVRLGDISRPSVGEFPSHLAEHRLHPE